MGKYRKKPVVVEAMQITAETTTPDDIAAFMNCPAGSTYSGIHDLLVFHTLEGTMRADVGDWIIKGVAGEFYPCKPYIFAATYEAVD